MNHPVMLFEAVYYDFEDNVIAYCGSRSFEEAKKFLRNVDEDDEGVPLCIFHGDGTFFPVIKKNAGISLEQHQYDALALIGEELQFFVEYLSEPVFLDSDEEYFL